MSEKRAYKKGEEDIEDFLQVIGRIVAGGYYDYQEVRLSSMNRLRGIVRTKNEGIDLTTPEIKKEEKTFDKKYSDEKIFPLLGEMKERGKIGEEEYRYVSKLEVLFNGSQKLEKDWKDIMMQYIVTETIWTDWLRHVKGISVVLCSNLLKEFGYCENYQHISSLWKHCGLHLVCPECTTEVTIAVETEQVTEQKKKTIPVTASEGGKCPICGKKGIGSRPKRGRSIDYNPKLKVLAWKIADSFIKQRTPYYRAIYDTEKARQLELMKLKAENAPERLLHAELRARRKTVKHFLAHYWYVARSMKDLPTEQPYVAARLGHTKITMPVRDEETGIWVIRI